MNTNQKIRIQSLEQFDCLYKDYREIALWSGRGAGKSWAVAQYLLLTALNKKIRILCCREILGSIKDSVKQLLANTIERLGLSDYYTVRRDNITTFNGTEFIFSGLKENLASIKSMEKITVCWVEEAHSISKDSLDILIPTVFRNSGAKMIYTYNPQTSQDVIYQRFHNESTPPKSIVHRVDWRDNPYFSEEMQEARKFDVKHKPELAKHIWEGALFPTGHEIAVLPIEMLKKCIDLHLKMNIEVPTSNCQRHLGLDLADGGADKSAIALRHGPLILHAKEFPKVSMSESVNTAHNYAQENGNIASLHFDSAGIGAGAKNDFNRATERTYAAIPFNGAMSPMGADKRYNVKQTNGDFFRNLKAQAWWNLFLRLENSLRLIDGIKVDPCYCLFISSARMSEDAQEKLLRELSQASYRHEDSKLTVDKQPNKEPSPNLADAVVMSFASDLRLGIGVAY